MTRLAIATLALLTISIAAFAQNADTKTQTADASGATQPSPSFVASLLLIKSDWSQAPAAKEIEEVLRKTLSGESVPADQLQKLPASGPAILFPTESALIYTPQNYAALLAWLKSKDLVMQTEPFSLPQHTAVGPPLASGKRRVEEGSSLDKDLNFLGLTFLSPLPDQPLVARKLSLTWLIQKDRRMVFSRKLSTWEKPRGEDQFVERLLHDSCSFNRETLYADEVLIVQAFPSANDRVFRVAAADKGFMALVVVEGEPSIAAPAAEPRLVLPDKVERLTVRKSPSAESNLMMDQSDSQPAPRNIISKNVMISWSEAKDVAWGFSISLGRWARQDLNPPANDVKNIIVDDNTAVWRVGSAYYAFSGETGRWDVLKLPDGHTPHAVLDNAFARVHDGDNVHTFASSTGRWSSPNDIAEATDTKPVDATDSKPVDEQIKVFTLRNAKANDAERLVSQLFPRDIQSVAADQRTNSLIVRGPPEQLNIIFHILTRLDEVGSNQTAAAGSRGPASPGPGGATVGSADTGLPSPTQVAELSKQYDAKEQQAAELARQIREQQSGGKGDKAKLDKLTADLRKAVAESFAVRKQLQQAEVTQLQQRLGSIQHNLKTREQLSDRIIDHRVKDLLDPDLQWESTSRPQAGTSATASSKTSTSGARPKVTMGFVWGRESEQVFSSLGLKVQQLTRNDAPDPSLIGAMKIISIDPDSPAKELQVGDLVVGLQSTPGRGRGQRRFELHVRSGNSDFPVIVEFSGQSPAPGAASPPADILPALGDTASATVYPQGSNLGAALAYRDKLGERLNQVNQLFRVGRVPLSEALQASTEFAQADIDSSENADERRAARSRAVDRLKEIKSIIDDKFKQGVEPSQNKLAVDAALIKAESDLASDSTPTAQPTAQPSAQPGAKTSSQLEPVGVNWMHSHTTSIIWDVLGVKVQDVTPDSVRKYGYNGGLLIDEVRPDAGNDLRPGDVILGVHHWETTQSSHLAWVLLQPVSKNVSIANPSARTSTETVAIRFLRGETVQTLQVTLPAWSLPERPSRTGSATKSQGESLPPTLNLPLAGDTTTIHSPDDFRRRLTTAAGALDRLKWIPKSPRSCPCCS